MMRARRGYAIVSGSLPSRRRAFESGPSPSLCLDSWLKVRRKCSACGGCCAWRLLRDTHRHTRHTTDSSLPHHQQQEEEAAAAPAGTKRRRDSPHTTHNAFRRGAPTSFPFFPPPPCLLLFLTCSTSHLPSSEPFLFLSVCCLSVRFTFLKSAGVLCTSGFCLKSASCVKTGLSFLTLPPRHPRFFFCFYCPLVSQGGAPTNSGVLKSSFLSGG